MHECDSGGGGGDGGGGIKTKEIAVPTKEPPAKREAASQTQTDRVAHSQLLLPLNFPFAFSPNSTWRSESRSTVWKNFEFLISPQGSRADGCHVRAGARTDMAVNGVETKQ